MAFTLSDVIYALIVSVLVIVVFFFVISLVLKVIKRVFGISKLIYLGFDFENKFLILCAIVSVVAGCLYNLFISSPRVVFNSDARVDVIALKKEAYLWSIGFCTADFIINKNEKYISKEFFRFYYVNREKFRDASWPYQSNNFRFIINSEPYKVKWTSRLPPVDYYVVYDDMPNTFKVNIDGKSPYLSLEGKNFRESITMKISIFRDLDNPNAVKADIHTVNALQVPWPDNDQSVPLSRFYPFSSDQSTNLDLFVKQYATKFSECINLFK